MDDMLIRAGEQLTFPIYQGDPSSVSATFIAQYQDVTITDTVEYVDGVALFEFGSPDTDVDGTYEYQVNENFETGSPDIYPSADDCDGGCGFPILEICESLPSEGS